MPRISCVLHWSFFWLVKHWCGFLSSRPVLDVAVYFIVLYMTTNFNERNYHRVTQKRNILHSPNNHSPCCKLSWLNPCGFTKGIMCELPAHIKGKKRVAQVASPARSMQSSTFFILFGLECVRLWNMGNFSLESYYTLLRYKETEWYGRWQYWCSIILEFTIKNEKCPCPGKMMISLG